MKSRMLNALMIGLFALGTVAFTGCSNKTASGSAIGAAAGGVVGAIIGENNDKTVEGAIAGAAIGGTAGALIGSYMDRQAEEMEKIEGVEVEREEEGIHLTFDSGILFEFDSARLQADARDNVAKLADILDSYERTNILIEGHTDARGSEDYNLELSEDRAESVADYLSVKGVESGRFTTVGYGESDPIASNDTENGRQLNRRVEIAVVASEELIDDAEDGRI